MQGVKFKPAVGNSVVEAVTDTTVRGWRSAEKEAADLFGMFVAPAEPQMDYSFGAEPDEPAPTPEPTNAPTP